MPTTNISKIRTKNNNLLLRVAKDTLQQAVLIATTISMLLHKNPVFPKQRLSLRNYVKIINTATVLLILFFVLTVWKL